MGGWRALVTRYTNRSAGRKRRVVAAKGVGASEQVGVLDEIPQRGNLEVIKG